MKSPIKKSALLLAVGFVLGAACVYVAQPTPVSAVGANSNDKFSMATVPINVARDAEAVFVLDHLTGVLRGGILSQNGSFDTTYTRNLAADFSLNPATPDPRYSLVTGLNANSGKLASGIVYVAELSSGGVIAYGFAPPRGRGQASLELVRLGAFPFREAAGG